MNIEVQNLKSAATGRWSAILSAVTDVDPLILDGKHHPCPRCAGVDRFRAFNDFNETGGLFCNQCFSKRNGDGIAAVQWLLDCTFQDAMTRITEHLGLMNGNRRNSNGQRKIVAEYDYLCAAGELLYQVVRFEPKDFRQRRPDGSGGWSWKLGDVERVLYRLPELIAADARQIAFIVEGEKDSDRLAEFGLVAVCSVGGGGKWKTEYSSHLEGRPVAILQDNDVVGRKHARQVAQSLHGTAESVRILELPDLPEGGDISDWLDAGGTKEQLLDIVEQADEWTPDATTPAASSPLRITCMDDISAEEVKFLWPGRIAMGKLHLFVGNPGQGKSFVMLDIAARVTTGAEWPDGSGLAPQGSVVLLVGEDGLADTIRPRLDVHGADASRVFVIQSRTIKSEEGESLQSPVRLDRDIAAIDQALSELDDVRIVFIDPISEYLGGTDSHKNSDVRGLLAPLAAMAEKHNVAIVSISHLNKNVGGPAIYRAMGSLAFTAHARIAWAFVADHEDPDRILFLPLKNNLHKRIPGLAFRIVSAAGETGQGVVEWEDGLVDICADDALNPEAPPKRNKLEDAVEWLERRLANGCVSSNQISEEAETEGIAFETLKRARKQLGVVSSKDRLTEKGTWWLSLPSSRSSEPPTSTS